MTISSFFKKIFSPLVVGNCLGMVALTFVLVFSTLQFIQCYTNHGDIVVVPNVRGMKVDVAANKLAALGLRMEVKDTGYVDTFVGDVVLEQEIRPGDKVKGGRTVFVTINASGPRAIALPLVADNASRREAESKLRAMGFRNIKVEYIPGDKDWVYSLKAKGEVVQAGTRLPVTTLLTLVVGDGVFEETFNGDDSLDFEHFGGNGDADEWLESGEGTDGVSSVKNESYYE